MPNPKRRSSHIRRKKKVVINIHLEKIAESVYINTSPGSDFAKIAGDQVANAMLEILNNTNIKLD